MDLINATRMRAACTLGLEPSGRELLVVVIKGTFVLPTQGEQVRLHDEQTALVTADTFTGDPGTSAPVLEMDFVPRKLACDVLLLGSAYAPGGRPIERTTVELRVGDMRKAFTVVGDRQWQAGLSGIRPSAPLPFSRLPISYDVAFGGTDQESDDPREHDAYRANPVGRGYRKHLRNLWVDGKPLPSTEELGVGVTWPANTYRPMALGPIGRGWAERLRYAGTYDERWLQDVFPFLPQDFDERYYQASSADQQIPFTSSPLEVSLTNLTRDGRRDFLLPHFEAPLWIVPKRGPREHLNAVLDTILLEPDAGRFSLTWRVARPLRDNMLEIAQVIVGRKGKEWWAQREHVSFPLPVVAAPSAPGA